MTTAFLTSLWRSTNARNGASPARFALTITPTYYGFTRTEILPLLPDDVDRVLEVGCGQGATLAWLKQLYPNAWTAGVEISSSAARTAKARLDMVYAGNIEELSIPIERNSLDLILCLDVLEHLVDPWDVVRRMHDLLKPGGVLIASIPNVRNKKVVVPLIFKGTWKYQDAGILDRTHLRFFVRETAIELIASAGLKIDRIDVTGGYTRGWSGPILKKILPQWIQSFLVGQYLLRGVKQ